jgi:hypothetical protein
MNEITNTFALTTMSIFNPRRSVIVDMVMVQVITIMISVLGILVFKGNDIPSGQMAWMVGALFGSFILASGIYSRIIST